MIPDELVTEQVGPPGENGAEAPPAPDREWKVDRQGREYVARPKGGGTSGNIYRRDGETISEALARDAKPKDQRPRRKPKAPKQPDPPREVDLKALEAALAEALKQPGMIAAMAGDEWAVDHFTTTGPYLARNLVLAADHNPWLRRKLEEAATGQDAMMKVMSMVGVGGALFLYVVPPVIYWLNLPVPEKARTQFGIPPRRERKPAYASTTQPPQPAEPETPLAA